MKYAAFRACTSLIFHLAGVRSATWHHNLKPNFRVDHKHPAHDGLEFSFEITNYNYYDLTKTTCPHDLAHRDGSEDQSDHAAETEHGAEVANAMDEIFKKTVPLEDMINSGMDAVDGAVKDVGQGVKKIEHGVEKVGKEIGKDLKGEGQLPWKTEDQGFLQLHICVSKHRQLRALKFQSHECETVEEVFRGAIKQVVTETLECFFGAPHTLPPLTSQFAGAPTPAIVVPMGMQPVGFLQNEAPAPAPMMAALSSAEDLEVYVAFEPGREMGNGKTIIVDIMVTGAADGLTHDLEPIEHMFEAAMLSNGFNQDMGRAFKAATGLTPRLGHFSVKKKHIELWDLKQCEDHLKSLVKRFSKTYTRERVPSALYNECTNFMTRVSFSRDYVLDKTDTVVCKETTARFARHWDYGKNAEDGDFELMCRHACTAKWGKDAPRCRHEHGPAPAPAPAPLAYGVDKQTKI